jgi:UDP-N-acetylmuramoylalanine--D-glutamate ligase
MSARLELRGKRVLVAGLGVSGSAAARFLAAHQASLVLTDARRDLAISDLPRAELHLGGEDPRWLSGADLMVVSPGVPRFSPLVQAAYAAHIPVIGELELASRFIEFPLLAITGTNGKSTVTALLGQICRDAGLRTFVGGNLGTPLVEAASGAFDLGVVEVSSYQLETIQHFKPRGAIYLNLSEDHLDRYQDLELYGAAKARVFENQDASDWAILNRDDPQVWKLRHRLRSQVMSFGFTKPDPYSGPAIWQDGGLQFALGALRGTISTERFRLPGRFNQANAMAAAAAALTLNLKPDLIERTLAEFCGLPHRLEFVAEHQGVTYIDDSKATNVDAVVQALAAVRPPVVLIAGGVDKGGSYTALRQPLGQKARLVVLYGAARDKMRTALDGTTRLESVEDLREALARAAAAAAPGDTVLLSPACASFDQFRDYAERGRVFQELVRAL